MDIRRELHLILDHVTHEECGTEEKELVRMIFERACAPALLSAEDESLFEDDCCCSDSLDD